MQNHNTNTRLGLTLATMGLALLTACGGGGETALPDVVSQLPVTPASNPTICGASTLAVDGAPAHQVSNDTTAVLNGVATQVSLVSSPTGYPFDGLPISLVLPLQDMREVMYLGYTPQATADSMGVDTPSRLAAGSVGCVTSVARIFNSGTDALPSYLLSWTSNAVTDLPLGLVPEHILNGFEFTHNFAATSATAVFRVSKTTLADAAGAQICHVASTSAVTCSAPVTTDGGDQWTLTQPITASGVYLLVAPRELVELH